MVSIFYMYIVSIEYISENKNAEKVYTDAHKITEIHAVEFLLEPHDLHLNN